MRRVAERTLLAPVEDVWAVLAEPHRLPDWWPGMNGVEPDRRGLAAGVRWRVHGSSPGYLRRPLADDTLVLNRVERCRLVEFVLVRDRLAAALELEAATDDRTVARLTLTARWLYGTRGSIPRTALSGLYELCQTGAES